VSRARHACLVVLAACGFQNGVGVTDAAGGHADAARDGSGSHPDTPLDASTMIAGTVYTPTPGPTGIAGATVVAAPSSNLGTQVASTTSSADGGYSLRVPDGFTGVLRASANGFVDTYMIVVPVFLGSANVDIQMLSGTQIFLAGEACNGTSQAQSAGLVGLEVVDTSMTPLAGATFSVTPSSGSPCYVASNGNLSGTATATSTQGTGLVFNVAAGSATLSASESGDTFAALSMDVLPGVYTTALIQQQ
jgi:hypothetical protein